MPPAPIPGNETQRLAALDDLGILDSAPEDTFDALVRAASLVCGTPIALISLLDAGRQWFKANLGLPGVPETPRAQAFCAHAILGDDLLEVADATQDARFADNPLVTGRPDIRFYAGVPLHLEDGSKAGTLCVIDRAPRVLDDTQREILRCLARAAESALIHARVRRMHRKVADDLRENQDRLRRLYEATPAMLYSVDGACRMVAVSDAWLERFGYAREEVIGRLSTDFVTEESRVHALAVTVPAFLATGRADDFEYRMVCKSGEIIDVLLSARLERDADGKPLRSLTVIQDVTRRQQAERALVEERQRLANLIEATGVGTWEWHIPSGALRLNERWAAIMGWTLAELAPVSIRTRIDLVHRDDLPESLRRLERHFAGETAYYELECRMRHRDGHFVWVLSRGAVMSRDAAGKPEWMFGTLKDITMRKRDEVALRKSEAFLEQTGQIAKVGGWEFDIATGVLTWTAETCRIHGLPPDFQPSLAAAIDFYAPEARPVIRAAVETALAGGGPWDLELPLIRADGQQIWVRSIGSVMLADGKPSQLAGVFQDVTARVAESMALREANERVTLATDSGRIGIWDWDIVADTMFWDDRMCLLYDIERPVGVGAYQRWRSRLHPDDCAAAEQSVRDAIEGIHDYDVAFRIIWGNGEVRVIRGIGRVIRDPAGKALRMLGSNWDVTDTHRLTAELARQHELLRVTLQSIGDGVITTDGGGSIVWLNPVAERLTGWLAAEAVGQKLELVFRIVNQETRLPAENPVEHCLVSGKTGGLANDTVLISRDGREFGIEDSAAPILSATGETLGAVLVFHDVTEARQLSGEMSFRASHDMLTGLLNRAEFEVRLRFVLHKAFADRSENALMFIDLDQFKLVNDGCGHAAGDLLLQQVARILMEAVRASDTLARLGGDEFAVILDHCSVEQAQRLAQRICDRMEEFRFIHEDRRFRVGASIGLVPVDPRWPNIAAVLQAADSSCYAAKEAGRNRVHVWRDSDTAMRAREGETQLATRLTQALDEDRFLLFAQCILPLRATCGGVHAEVLLRMLASDGTLVQPGAFLPAAERFHLASRIDRWVLRRAVAWMQAAPAQARIETLCINLSGQSVSDRVFHRWAIEMLSEAGPAIRSRLCLEITETAAVTNLEDAAAFIAQARAIGVRVALDDFGAGASSFGYLKSMPVDFLKIDGQFIRNLVNDPLDEAAVRCFADVAAVVGMRTVAEFVDDAAVLDKLRLMGIDFAQGYLIHRPAPIDELLEVPADRAAE